MNGATASAVATAPVSTGHLGLLSDRYPDVFACVSDIEVSDQPFGWSMTPLPRVIERGPGVGVAHPLTPSAPVVPSFRGSGGSRHQCAE